MIGWVVNGDTHWAFISKEEVERAKNSIRPGDVEVHITVLIWIYKPYKENSLSSGRYRLHCEDTWLVEKMDQYIRPFGFYADDPEYLRETLVILQKEGGWWGL